MPCRCLDIQENNKNKFSSVTTAFQIQTNVENSEIRSEMEVLNLDSISRVPWLHRSLTFQKKQFCGSLGAILWCQTDQEFSTCQSEPNQGVRGRRCRVASFPWLAAFHSEQHWSEGLRVSQSWNDKNKGLLWACPWD